MVGLKFAHVLIAIVALGTSAGLGLLLEFHGDHPTHGAFVLRAVRTLLYAVAIPGYLLMLITGMWMGNVEGLLGAHWTEAAMNLWGVGALFIGGYAFVLHRRVAGSVDRRMVMGGRLSSKCGRLFPPCAACRKAPATPAIICGHGARSGPACG